jgi:hypothetical protein
LWEIYLLKFYQQEFFASQVDILAGAFGIGPRRLHNRHLNTTWSPPIDVEGTLRRDKSELSREGKELVWIFQCCHLSVNHYCYIACTKWMKLMCSPWYKIHGSTIFFLYNVTWGLTAWLHWLHRSVNITVEGIPPQTLQPNQATALEKDWCTVAWCFSVICRCTILSRKKFGFSFWCGASSLDLLLSANLWLVLHYFIN